MVVEVIIALNTPMLFTYRVEKGLRPDINVGSMVSVPLGKCRIYSAIVVAITDREVDDDRLKNVINIIEPRVLSSKQLELWRWISAFYMVKLSDLSSFFLPPSLKMSHKVAPLEDIVPLKSAKREIVETFITLAPQFHSPQEVEKECERLRRSKAKVKVLETIASTSFERGLALKDVEISKKELQNLALSPSAISELAKENILILEKRRVEKTGEQLGDFVANLHFSEEVKADLSAIKSKFQDHNTLLLKTNKRDKSELYIALISSILAEGKGEVLWLSDPYNAKSTYKRFSEAFGDHFIGENKSRTALLRHEDYMKVLNNKSSLLVAGGRSALGLPFSNLRLVIVDNEHEDFFYGSNSYNVNFNGRDCGVYLAYIHGAKSLLTSEFPSYESYFNVEKGKYGFLEIMEKSEAKISIIDRGNIARKEDYIIQDGIAQRRYISHLIIDQIAKRLERGEVSFLYQNRKGFSTVVKCKECGAVVMCKECNVPLIYRKATDSMNCRYCNSSSSRAEKCPECGSKNIQPQGIGTENIEHRISELFPQARVVRVDGDTMDKPSESQKIRNLIKEGEVDIIVGTGIVSKLSQIKNLTLVGVINGDNLFSFPDFKATERGFCALTTLYNTLEKTKESLMVVQISDNKELSRQIGSIVSNNYHQLYQLDMVSRQKFCYPPFCKILIFTLQHKELDLLNRASTRLCNKALEYYKDGVIGPFAPQIDRIRNRHISKLMVKVKNPKHLKWAKEVAQKLCAMLAKEADITLET